MFATKKVALSVLSAAALIASVTLSALPASASTLVPAADPISCSGDLCIQNISQNGSSSTIKAWAKTTTFTGHFELQYPDGVVKNSPNEKWTAGGAGYDFTKVPEANGYNMTAWKGTSHFVSVGELGFNVD